MIEVGSEVKLNGAVSDIDTGKFSVSINEFYVDGQWKRFVSAKTLEVSTSDYDNSLTASELAFISSALEQMQSNMSFNNCEKDVARSIVKKLKN